jgi:hypothetical protein
MRICPNVETETLGPNIPLVVLAWAIAKSALWAFSITGQRDAAERPSYKMPTVGRRLTSLSGFQAVISARRGLSLCYQVVALSAWPAPGWRNAEAVAHRAAYRLRAADQATGYID